MFRNLTNWYYPDSVEEALALLRKNEIVPYSGGTGILRVKSNRIKGLVNLGGLPLSYIRDSGEQIRIGAGTTFNEIAENDLLHKSLHILQQAAGQAASTPLRNLITIGGSLVTPPIWSDLPSVLLVLNALIVVQGNAAGIYNAEDFFEKNPLDGLSLITEIRFPKLPGKSNFIRLTRTKFDYSYMDIAVYIHGTDVLKATRVAIGCCLPKSRRLKEVENILNGKQFNKSEFRQQISELAINFVPDRQFSQNYRKSLLIPKLANCIDDIM